MSQDLIMDSNDQERERGITILAKNTAVIYKDTKINIIDTPGHADFGGEVERTLNMADGALLIIDAQEGPMAQTKFVLKKALDLGLKVIVIINKIDKPNARIDTVINRTQDLFLDLATDEAHLDFPVFYAIGREGKSWPEIPENMKVEADLVPIFDAILEYVPEPNVSLGDFQMLVTALDADSYQGTYSIGRINRGSAKPGLNVSVINANGHKTNARIEKVYVNSG
jgi:GTP-binding protein